MTQGKGTLDAKAYTLSGEFNIVDGSGTAGLEGVSGTGSFESKPTKTGKGSVEYKFEVLIPVANQAP